MDMWPNTGWARELETYLTFPETTYEGYEQLVELLETICIIGKPTPIARIWLKEYNGKLMMTYSDTVYGSDGRIADCIRGGIALYNLGPGDQTEINIAIALMLYERPPSLKQ